jgi:Protein of unknown function (DUF3277)
MGQVTQYDSKNVSAQADSIYITGFADGTFIEAEKNEDNHTPSVGAQGDVVVAKTNDPTGVITFTLQQTSPSVAYLDRLANTGAMVPFWVISNNLPKEKVGGQFCSVAKPANKSFSNEAESREFEVQVYDYTVE